MTLVLKPKYHSKTKITVPFSTLNRTNKIAVNNYTGIFCYSSSTLSRHGKCDELKFHVELQCYD